MNMQTLLYFLDQVAPEVVPNWDIGKEDHILAHPKLSAYMWACRALEHDEALQQVLDLALNGETYLPSVDEIVGGFASGLAGTQGGWQQFDTSLYADHRVDPMQFDNDMEITEIADEEGRATHAIIQFHDQDDTDLHPPLVFRIVDEFEYSSRCAKSITDGDSTWRYECGYSKNDAPSRKASDLAEGALEDLRDCYAIFIHEPYPEPVPYPHILLDGQDAFIQYSPTEEYMLVMST